MYLKRIELQGFKSFADKTIIDLEKGITSIVGPNGSGKSNISDAIRYVLGEQSMKNLRGIKPQDLIFAGTLSRKALGFAQVTLVFDNIDQTLPIEFNEVKVSRRIYRDGQSQMFLNDTQVRLKDITELFLDTGIGKDGYSLIRQGKVDQILSSKSEDRRHIFDEASGIVKYIYRKDESEKKLEKTKLNLLRISDIIDEIQSNLEPLALMANKAEKYLELKKDIKLKETNLIKLNIDKLKDELKQNQKDIEELNVYINQLKNDFTHNSLYQKDLKQKQENIELEIDNLAKVSFEAMTRIEENKSNLKINDNQIENISSLISELKSSVTQAKHTIEQNKNEIVQKAKKQELYLQNNEKYETLYTQKKAEYDKIYLKLSDNKKEQNKIKDEIEKLKDESYEKSLSFNLKSSDIETLKTSIIQNEKLISENVKRLERIKINNEDSLKEFSKFKEKIDNINVEINANKEDIKTLNKKKILNELDLKNANEKVAKLQGQIKVLEENEKANEGFANSVKALIDNKKVIGTVAKLFKVEDKNLKAIEIALGNKIQNIVVENRQDAKQLIEYLKQNKIGRATFLPVDELKVNVLDTSKFEGEKGFIGTGDKLVVSCDKSLEKVAKYLLGNFVIVDNLDNAMALSKKFSNLKIITLDGDFVSSDGSLTGGYKNLNPNSILGRQNRIAVLKKDLEKDVLEVEKLEEIHQDFERQISEKNEIVQQLNSNYDKVNLGYIEVREQNKYILLDIEKIEEQNKRFALQNETKQNKISEIEKETELLKTELEDNEKTLKELDDKLKTFDFNQMDEKIDSLKDEISDLKISLSSIAESKSSIDEIISRIENENVSLNNQVEKYEKQILENEQKIENIKDENSKIEKLILDIQNSNNVSDEKVEKLRQEKIIVLSNIKKYENRILELQKSIDIEKEKTFKFENKSFRINEQINSLIEKLWNDYELTPNNIVELYDITNIAKTQKEIEDKKEQVKALGDISINSIEEYKTQNQRYEFLSSQKKDLEQTIRQLRELISTITLNMKVQFEKNFKIINKNFQEVFSELFGGGQAYLELEDKKNILESGIEIKVQPPGKKLQNMNLLSGGEKALTAISILFAILKMNPAPFCVLDEIEAALDDVNVYRFSNYVSKLAESTQFLIITHRKGTMEIANSVYGITMEEKGISKLLSLKL